MDLITLALAEQYTDSQRLGSVDVPEPITWDGDTTGLTIVDLGDFMMAQVSPEAFDLMAASSIDNYKKDINTDEVTFDSHFEREVGNLSLRYVFDDDIDLGALSIWYDAGDYADVFVSIAVVAPYDIDDFCETGISIPKGTYMVYREDETSRYYPGLIEFAGTVNPIDQRLIPALDNLTLNGADGKQYKLTVDKNGDLVHTAIT